MAGDEGIRLLIVDDESDFLRAIARRLELRGFAVTQATSGPEAIRAARAAPPELALLDLKMPGMSGAEVLTALKGEHPLLEVVVLTGHGSLDEALQSQAAGAFAYLPKPCELPVLLETLARALERRLRQEHAEDEPRLAALDGARDAGDAVAVLRALRRVARGD